MAVFQLPSNIYPELNFPRIVVLAHSGDLAPDTMLLTVTRPLEEAVSTTSGRAARAIPKPSAATPEISILFQPDTDMQYALQLVQARVSEARSSLAAGYRNQVERITARSISRPEPHPEWQCTRRRFARRRLLRPAAAIQPCARRRELIQVQATDTREVSVIVDPQKDARAPAVARRYRERT